MNEYVVRVISVDRKGFDVEDARQGLVVGKYVYYYANDPKYSFGPMMPYSIEHKDLRRATRFKTPSEAIKAVTSCGWNGVTYELIELITEEKPTGRVLRMTYYEEQLKEEAEKRRSPYTR